MAQIRNSKQTSFGHSRLRIRIYLELGICDLLLYLPITLSPHPLNGFAFDPPADGPRRQNPSLPHW
jgi:hypothetical protein